MIRTVVVAATLAIASTATATERPVLTKDVAKGCEVASTNVAFIKGTPNRLPKRLKQSAEQCVQVTQDLISKGAENGICPKKQPVASLVGTASVVFYLMEFPADMKRPFSEVATKALQRTFPCNSAALVHE